MITEEKDLHIEQSKGEKVTFWFVNEGTLGCFKDIVLSSVKFEPVLVNLPPSSLDEVEEDEEEQNISGSEIPKEGEASANKGSTSLDAVNAVRHVLVGCEGSAMTVLHENLPFEPYVGCWIRFKRFGAYTNSLASTDISDAKTRKSYFWCEHA
jgi:hypothetical protein